MGKLSILALVIVEMTMTLFQVKSVGQRSPVITLSSSEQVFSETFFIKDVAVRMQRIGWGTDRP